MSFDSDTSLKEHIFEFNPDDNGGEVVLLVTNFYDNGDRDGHKSIYTLQELEMNSYGKSARLGFSSLLTPAILRKLADELEQAEQEAVELASLP